MTQFPRTRFDLNLARIVLSDRVTFYDPRSSSNTPGLLCNLITHERRSPLSFSKNESRAFEVSLEEKLSISRFDDDHPVGKRVKAKKLHGQFFLFNSILPFPFLPSFFSFSRHSVSEVFASLKTNIQSFRRYPPSGITREIS